MAWERDPAGRPDRLRRRAVHGMTSPLRVVSEVLGHASIAITKDVYGHLLGGEKQAATEAITDVLFSRPDDIRGSSRRSTVEDG